MPAIKAAETTDIPRVASWISGESPSQRWPYPSPSTQIAGGTTRPGQGGAGSGNTPSAVADDDGQIADGGAGQELGKGQHLGEFIRRNDLGLDLLAATGKRSRGRI